MNKRSYARLPDDLKHLIDEEFSGVVLGEKATRCFEETDALGIEIARKAGHTVVRATPEQVEEARRKVAPVVEEILAELETKGLPARATYRELREGIDRHSTR